MIILFVLIPWILLSMETDPGHAVCSVDHFVLEGGQIRLTVERHQQLQFRRFAWKFNSAVILEYTNRTMEVEPLLTYKKTKMTFNSTDLSLFIKNVEESEMGFYTAVTANINGKETEEYKYNLHVQKAVPKPTLNLRALHLNSTEGFCNVSVNCSVGGNWVSYSCDRLQCTELEKSTYSDVNITLTPRNGIYFCTGSNHVSKASESEPVEPMCMKNYASKPAKQIYIVILGICMVLVIVAFIFVVKRHHVSQKHTITQRNGSTETDTFYSVPRSQRMQQDLNDSQAKPETVYATLGHATDQVAHTAVIPRREDPTSLYSVVRK